MLAMEKGGEFIPEQYKPTYHKSCPPTLSLHEYKMSS